MQEKKEFGIQISKQTFLQSLYILLGMMFLAGLLTQLIQPGSYAKKMINGVEVIIPNSFHYLNEQNIYPIYRWFTAPFEVFVSKDSLVLIVIMLFILFVGGSFAIFDATRIFEVVITNLSRKFINARKLFIAIITLFFMLLGAVFGIFEEIIPLIPLVVMIAKRLGWDELMGLGLSLLATGFGFSAAIYNPFTIGVAQQLAGLPLFSGILYRLFIFVVIYLILLYFLIKYAKKLEDNKTSFSNENIIVDELSTSINEKTSLWLMSISFLLLLIIMMSLPFSGLSDYSMPVIALGFVLISFLVGLVNQFSFRNLLLIFAKGMLNISPSLILIILAMSVKQIFLAGQIMDTILYNISQHIVGLAPVISGFVIYLFVFVLQFFIPSATAKAFLVIPILTQLGDLLNLTRQSVVLAFNFGDGFSHLLYPTNPALLIALSLTSIRYTTWLKWTIWLQAIVFGLTMFFLSLAIIFHYGPM